MLGKKQALLLGSVLAALLWFVCRGRGLPVPACWTAAATTLCATWWVPEPIPIPPTSIRPRRDRRRKDEGT